MTEGRKFGGVPFGGVPFEGLPFTSLVPWTELAGLAAAGRSLMPDVPAALARTVTEQLIGQRLTATVDGAEIGLTLTELHYPADSLRLATGRIGDVRIVAENVDWPERDPQLSDAPRTPDGPDAGGSGETRCETRRETGDTSGPPGQRSSNQPEERRTPGAPPENQRKPENWQKPENPQTPEHPSISAPANPGTQSRAHPDTQRSASAAPVPLRRVPLRRVIVLAKDVRVRSLPTPSVIPAEVGLAIFVDGDVVRERVAALRPGIVATPHHDGLQLRWTRHPKWGHLTLEPTVNLDAVVLTPSTLHIGQWRFPAPKRIRPIVLPLPELPKGLRLTGVRAEDGELVLHTVADEWPERLARIPLGDLLGWLTTAALTLTLPRLDTRS